MQSRSRYGDKKASCLQCRHSKVKCVRDEDSMTCRKCCRTGTECITPEYHVGRHKGSKNKRTTLERAITQVEEAMKRSSRGSRAPDAAHRNILEQLMAVSNSNPASQTDQRESLRSILSSEPPGHDSRPGNALEPTSIATQAASDQDKARKSPDVMVENADNPLQLLAMASTLPGPSALIAEATTTGVILRTTEHTDLDQFFRCMGPKRESSLEWDPIEIGLITVDEASELFDYFYDHLSHTRWGLDPDLHTASFVRYRSAYLFTSILAATALFLPDATALSKRLSIHRDRLTDVILCKKYRSTEIVLALMVNVPWMAPSKCWSDDQTCTFLAIALSIAFDLSLNKVVTPSTTIRPAVFWERAAKADCIDATRALQLEGIHDADSSSLLGKRILRTRERVWLALFVLDRGVCLARGRPYTVPTGPLVESCDTWHISDYAGQWDSSLVSAAVLRRDLVGLISGVRDACNNTKAISPSTSGGTSLVKHLKDIIDRFFGHWTSIWSVQVTQGDGRLPPYVEILATHTRLSTYCSVINHPTAPPEAKQFFRAAGLKEALNVMRVAVHGEARLMSMPNNTVIMISFAACFALALGASATGIGMTLAPNTRSLIAEVAVLLLRIGNVTRHRQGASSSFGEHIRRILARSEPASQSFDVACGARSPAVVEENGTVTSNGKEPQDGLSNALHVTFDMTDDQIMDAINNASAIQEPFQLDESMVLDWFDWPNVT